MHDFLYCYNCYGLQIVKGTVDLDQTFFQKVTNSEEVLEKKDKIRKLGKTVIGLKN